MIFRIGTSLKYQRNEITYVEVFSRGLSVEIDRIKISDSEKIERIINFINSLKVVETEQPKKITDEILHGSVDPLGFISIGFVTYSHPDDIIQFRGNYMTTSYNGRDWEGKCYYVKNSGYNDKTKHSVVYQFLYDLINE